MGVGRGVHVGGRVAVAVAVALMGGCSGDDGGASDTEITAPTNPTNPTSVSATGTTTGTDTGTGTDSESTGATTAGPGTTDEPSSTTASTTAAGCGACIEPNQECVDDVCVTYCQGQDPDPCGDGQVCDVQTGECVAPDDPCVLAGPEADCGDARCGPGTVCDGQGACIPIAPCSAATCTSDGHCWGSACGCVRAPTCDDPPSELLAGEFSTDIASLTFADDCSAWMVTLRAGPDYVRRLTAEGELSTWTGTTEKDLGEVKVLRQLSIPGSYPLGHPLVGSTPEPQPVMGYGEVVVTYICCEACGCGNTPQGVAKVDDEDPMAPLPIIIPAEITSGVGPFANQWTDSGPQGLTWGNDRVLYVGNASANGDINRADLDAMTDEMIGTLGERVTAGAPVSDAHLLFAVEGGDLYRYNVVTGESEYVVGLGDHVTSLSHDAFSGLVYAGLANLEIVAVHPFSGEVSDFGTMPSRGRIAVSPSGTLWFTPVMFVEPGSLMSWPLPEML